MASAKRNFSRVSTISRDNFNLILNYPKWRKYLSIMLEEEEAGGVEEEREGIRKGEGTRIMLGDTKGAGL